MDGFPNLTAIILIQNCFPNNLRFGLRAKYKISHFELRYCRLNWRFAKMLGLPEEATKLNSPR